MSGPARFRFLSVESELTRPTDWDRAEWPRLWRYNLHYFDDLVAEGAAGRAPWHRALIERWVAENAPGHGTGWEPYPTSLRIVNWIKWALVEAESVYDGESRLSDAGIHSLAVQARWLRARLEIHLLGNHLWANAKALIFAGAFFDGPQARGWLDKALAVMRQELREQILPDGGHFERSPMYHATLLEDLLDLVQLADRYPGVIASDVTDNWRQAAGCMLRWLRVMTHPDGGIAFFNDAAFDIAASHAALEVYARRVLALTAGSGKSDDEPRIDALPDSGYVRLQSGPAVLIADVAPIGPDYLPGHAHADTLSFELSLHGRRVFVNSGTSTYTVDPERLRQRGTHAHNTVVVDGADSSEVWSSFRVARRARPLDVAWGRETDGTLWVRAGHDGYRRLPGRVVHRREWRLTPTNLTVVDRLDGEYRSAHARFHLHPEATPGDVGADVLALRTEPSTWHPRFGEAHGNQVLVADFDGDTRIETTFHWPPA